MWSSAELLVNYGEVAGTMVVAGALADWSLNDRQRARLAAISTRLRGSIAGIRGRVLLDRFGCPQMQRNFLAAVFLCDALIVSYLAHDMNYGGTRVSARDVLAGDLLLFVMPLGVAAAALATAGPRFVALVTARGSLFACLGKCVVAALAAGALGYGALHVMTMTYGVFGPRALLDWWDPRLWIYAVEYAVSGLIVSAMVIASLLAAILAAAGVATMLVALTLMQTGLLAGLIGRYPRGALLGSAIAIAGLATLARSWM
jgi:hypothetical protein